MKKLLGSLLWAAISILAALCLGTIAIGRNEHINSFWLVVAAACTYLGGKLINP
jgi:carbon starvation protein